MESDNATAKTIFTFEAVPEGMKFGSVNDIEVKGKVATILGPLAKRRVESLMKEQNQAFTRYVESMN